MFPTEQLAPNRKGHPMHGYTPIRRNVITRRNRPPNLNGPPRLLIFASPGGGGSGFENLFNAQLSGKLRANIVGVVSETENGGVMQRAGRLQIPFVHFPGPWEGGGYNRIVNMLEARYVLLSGWSRLVKGLDASSATGLSPRSTINIHPALTSKFGGKGMHGLHVHEVVMASYKRDEITHTIICMHFATAGYDEGPVFLRFHVRIRENDTPETLQKRVGRWEHFIQPTITNLVVNREITWDGKDPASLQYPSDYSIDQYDEESVRPKSMVEV
jgi:folate-dependent phosphoribosylglycinamide formyltransferase PurN